MTEPPKVSMKSIYLNGLFKDISKVLTLMDRNPYSDTYGCFDRNYWHYKTKDFPSGMSQEFLLALAQVYCWQLEENSFYQEKKLKTFVEAGIAFARKASRRDGSADDYYPFERALGAAVFSLHAMTEACMMLGLERQDFLPFFEKRADWIMDNEESGLLANHHAIAALALWNVFLLTQKKKYQKGAEQKAAYVLNLQTDEGWYQEYEGCSPGYLTVTIDFFSQYYLKTKDKAVFESLNRAIDFFAHVQHPDGTIGGDYDSRNVAIFHPNGFENMAPYSKTAGRVANAYLAAKAKGLLAAVSDDYIFGHSLISNINAYHNCKDRDFDLLNEKQTGSSKSFFPQSGLYVLCHNDYWGIFNLQKGGVGKVYRNQELVYADAGAMVSTRHGPAVSGLMDNTTRIDLDDSGFRVSKPLIRYSQHYTTPLIFMVFRIYLFLFGPFRWSSNLIRMYLQRKMIVGKKRLPASFSRSLMIDDDRLKISSEISGARDCTFAELSAELVPIYTAVSECFQKEMLTVEKRVFTKNGEKWIHEETV